MATDLNMVGTDGDDVLGGGPGTNEFTGGLGSDVIDAAQGTNTIFYNPGDGVDTVCFSVPRTYQYADYLQASVSALNELDSFSGTDYSNTYFQQADSSLFQSLPSDIAGVLTQLHDGSVTVDAARTAFSELVNWINTPTSTTIDFGPGISPSDITIQMGSQSSFGTPLEFSVSVKGQEGMLFEYEGFDGAANSSGGPVPWPIAFNFAGGETVPLSSLLSTNQVGSIGAQMGTEGNDTLVGSLSNDFIMGQGGDDKISGGAGFDYLDGGTGNDVIDGGSGSDYMFGDEGNDVLAAGRDGGLVSGGAGNDVYLFNAGQGALTIDNQGAQGDVDTLSLGRIDPSEVTASYNPNNGQLTLQVTATGDQITMPWFDPNSMAENSNQVISKIQFIDEQGHARVFDLAAIVHDTVSDPSAWYSDVPLFADGAHELTGAEPLAGAEYAVRYAVTGELFGPAAPNLAPVASQIAQQTAQEDAPFSFSVSGAGFSDPEGQPLTFAATTAQGEALPGWLQFDAATGTFSGTPTNDNVGTLSLHVTATDAGGLSAAQDFDLVVQNTNDAPTVANALLDQNAKQGEAFSYVVSASTFADVDAGDALTLSATQADGSALPSWLNFDASSGTFSGTPANGDVGPLSVLVTAKDIAGATASTSFNIGVANTNDAPTVANGLIAQSTKQGDTFSYTVPSNTFADIDVGDALTLSATQGDGSALPSWLKFDAATQTFSGTPTNDDVGSLSVQVTAKDIAGATTSTSFSIGVANVNDAPTVSHPIANQNATEDAPFSFVVPVNTFADIDVGDSLSLSASLANGSALPSWLKFDAATGTFSGTPVNADVGTLGVQVTARDLAGTSISNSFQLAVANTNDAPTLAAPLADQTMSAGTPFKLTLPANSFQDVDVGDALSYSARMQNGDPLPAWLSFDPTTRTLSGTPGSTGTWSIQVTASDLSGASVSDIFALTVNQSSSGQTLTGGNGNDVLTGGSGNDTLDGRNGKDVLSGGDGNDTLQFSVDGTWKRDIRTNAGSGDTVDLKGKRASYDIYDGGAGNDKLVGTSGDDAILLDDRSSPAAGGGARIKGIERIEAGAGNDVVDLTSKRYAYGDVTIDGGSGNDVVWSGAGNDVVLGGTGNDRMDGGAGNDYLDGGTGSDVMNGGRGVDLLQGGAGNDQLTDNSGNGLMDGGAGNDTLVNSSANSMMIGGAGNDTLVLGGGYDVIAFNRGDGKDVVSGKDAKATLSLGGGIRYQDLTLRRSGSALVLEDTAGDRITFDKWYDGKRYQSVSKLQIVTGSPSAAQSADPLANDKVETFDFKGVVAAFDAANSAHHGVSKWALTNALAQFQLGGSNTAALGGDVAYDYGVNGTLAGVAMSAAQEITNSAQFGRQAQTLKPQAQPQDPAAVTLS